MRDNCVKYHFALTLIDKARGIDVHVCRIVVYDTASYVRHVYDITARCRAVYDTASYVRHVYDITASSRLLRIDTMTPSRLSFAHIALLFYQMTVIIFSPPRPLSVPSPSN